MNQPADNLLSESQLASLGSVLHGGAAQASAALGRWVGKPTSIAVEAVEQLPLHEATDVLGAGAKPICFCAAEMGGRLTGQVILAFDDASGLALADLLLDQPRGTATEWGEIETSAALETTNILGCTYLNVLARALPGDDNGSSELLPSPPRFGRDFAESLVEFSLMTQVVASTNALLARTQFRIDGDPVDWTLLLVPDAGSMFTLCELLK